MMVYTLIVARFLDLVDLNRTQPAEVITFSGVKVGIWGNLLSTACYIILICRGKGFCFLQRKILVACIPVRLIC